MILRDPLWQTTGTLLRHKRRLLGAMVCSLVSAACFGAGLGMVLPLCHVMLGEGQSLRDLILAGATKVDWVIVQEAGDWIASLVPADRFEAFVLVMAGIAMLSLISAVGRYWHSVLIVGVVEQEVHEWRLRIHERLTHVPLTDLLRRGGAEWITHISRDTDVLGRGYLALFERGWIKLLNGVLAMAIALWLNWRLSLLAVIGGPVAIVLIRWGGRHIRRATTRALELQQDVLNVLKETTRHFRTVKAYRAEGHEGRRFEQVSAELRDQQAHLRSTASAARMGTDALAVIGVAAISCVAAWDIFRRNVSPQEFTTVLVLLVAAAASLQLLTRLNNQLQESSAAAARILRCMKQPIESTGDETQHSIQLPRHCESITFDHVTFTYPGQEKPAVCGVSLAITHGQMMAIVGGNGSGKTTLLSLLPRLIKPAAGRIFIDGHDIATAELASLRDQVSIVTQHAAIFQGTIAQNIAYGRHGATIEAIETAAKAAHAHEFIRALPDGFATKLGEDGVGLSGGQEQRLCLARAMLRDPAILILDEATSQVDSESESRIAEVLAEQRGKRTMIVIAHRLSTVIGADQIAVMHDGAVVDQGTHADLLARSDNYHRLVHSQLQAGSA